MNPRITSSIRWALACTLPTMGVVYRLHPKPTWLVALVGLMGLVVGPMIAAMGWAGAGGLTEGLTQEKVLHDENPT